MSGTSVLLMNLAFIIDSAAQSVLEAILEAEQTASAGFSSFPNSFSFRVPSGSKKHESKRKARFLQQGKGTEQSPGVRAAVRGIGSLWFPH